VIPTLPKYLFNRESPLRFHLRADSSQWLWLLHFLRACTPARYRKHTAELSALSYFSRDTLHDILAHEPIDFDYSNEGKLVLHRDPRAFKVAASLAEFQKDIGAEQRVLDADACIGLEPALVGLHGKFAGGVFTPSEDAGDCQKFCAGLDAILRDRYGVERLYHHKIGALKHERSRVRAVLTDRGEVEADAFVLTAALSSRDLAAPLGVKLPLCSLKGYSLTVPVSDETSAPRISVTDSQHKIVYARLGKTVRIAAMVDIGARHAAIDQGRMITLKRQVLESFPHIGNLEDAHPWAGERPATAEGKPIISASPYENLYLNVGHGALGFTLSPGSGKLVSELISGGQTSIDPAPFRYGTVH
jgi:D-amino-acid dehydrogenase